MMEIYDDVNELEADCLIPVLEKLINLISRLENRVMAPESFP